MLWCAMCRMVYVYGTLSSLALSSQPVCAWVGWHRCLTVCTYAYSINYSTTLIIIIVIIIHTIQYIYYNYTHTKYDICLHYTVSCEEAMLYTNSCIYYTMLYYVHICSIPLWYMTMYITSHTILIYYNNYYYDNSNSYLFLFLLLCCCMCVCACMCCAVSSLLSVYVCSLVCPRIYSYMCICVCLPRLTLLDCAVVKRLMCWYRGVYFGKKFLQNLENGYTR